MRQSRLALARVLREMGPRKAHGIEPGSDGAKTDFDIAQTFAGGELGESQAKELVETGKASDFAVPAVAIDRAAELGHRGQAVPMKTRYS